MKLKNTIFYGHQGTGKTTYVNKILTNYYGGEKKNYVFEINGSLNRNIDFYKKNIVKFCNNMFFMQYNKTIFIDEADYLTEDVQHYLIYIIKKNPENYFYLTCNIFDNIIPELSCLFKTSFFEKEEEEKFLENIESNDPDIFYISNGDYRVAKNIIGLCKYNDMDNILNLMGIISKENIEKVLNICVDKNSSMKTKYNVVNEMFEKNNICFKKNIDYFSRYIIENDSYSDINIFDDLSKLQENINEDYNYKIQLINFIIILKNNIKTKS